MTRGRLKNKIARVAEPGETRSHSRVSGEYSGPSVHNAGGDMLLEIIDGLYCAIYERLYDAEHARRYYADLNTDPDHINIAVEEVIASCIA